jgi:hypothetical protein
MIIGINMKKKMKRIAPMTKILNGRRIHVCDYHGTCTNNAYKEVYPMLVGKNGWSYLCRKHFEQERKRRRGKLPYCSVE